MTAKKWLILFLATILLLLAMLAGFNAFVDPFGAFGDPIFDWFSYNTTQNPRVAKITYLNRQPDRFDSFIIGPSGASGFPVAPLNDHLDANFFNLFTYGADMRDMYELAVYAIDHYGAQNIVLAIYIGHPTRYDFEVHPLTDSMHPLVDGSSRLSFFQRYMFINPRYSIEKIRAHRNQTYLPQAFNVFDMETGAYDKRGRAAEPIGCLDEYLQAYPVFLDYPTWYRGMWYLDEVVARVAGLRDHAEAAGTNLFVFFMPVYHEQFVQFYPPTVTRFMTALANEVPFWDFSTSTISYDPRFFYDATHFRGAVGDMAVARVFGDDSIFIPDDFGVFVTPENVADHTSSLFTFAPQPMDSYTATVPVLMYHHFRDEPRNDMEVSPETFWMHMQTLYENGFTTITLQQLIDFVDHGTPLPERPVILTFDDVYLSVYEYAFPAMQYFGHHGISFVIGSAVGTEFYGTTRHPTIPKFSFEQARTMQGVMDIQSHSYDMHQWQPFEVGRARENILMWDDEDEFSYVEILRRDHGRMMEIVHENLGHEVIAIGFPHGKYDRLSQAVLQSMGLRVSFSTRPVTNTVIQGLPQSLLSLGRFNVTEDVTAEDLLAFVSSARG